MVVTAKLDDGRVLAGLMNLEYARVMVVPPVYPKLKLNVIEFVVTVQVAVIDCTVHIPPVVSEIVLGRLSSILEPLFKAFAILIWNVYTFVAAVTVDPGVTVALRILPAVVVTTEVVVACDTRSLDVEKYIWTMNVDMFLTLPG